MLVLYLFVALLHSTSACGSLGTCFGYTCEYLLADWDFTCSNLDDFYGCDCYDCGDSACADSPPSGQCTCDQLSTYVSQTGDCTNARSSCSNYNDITSWSCTAYTSRDPHDPHAPFTAIFPFKVHFRRPL